MTGPVTSVRPATILQILRRRVETTVIVRPVTPASVSDIVTSVPLTNCVISTGVIVQRHSCDISWDLREQKKATTH